MSYIDGYVVPVPLAKLAVYWNLARKAGKVWIERGALAVNECVADDVKPGKLTSFPQSVMLRDDETVVFSWIVYRSRKDRRPHQCQGGGRPAAGGHAPFENPAIRCQAHVLGRLQARRAVVRMAPSTLGHAAMPVPHAQD